MRERGDYVVIDCRDGLDENYHFSKEDENELVDFFSQHNDNTPLQQMFDTYCGFCS